MRKGGERIVLEIAARIACFLPYSPSESGQSDWADDEN